MYDLAFKDYTDHNEKYLYHSSTEKLDYVERLTAYIICVLYQSWNGPACVVSCECYVQL
jgi:hypothetical protein